MAKVQIETQNRTIEVPVGATLKQILEQFPDITDEVPLAAIAYNRLVGLDCRVRMPTRIKWIFLNSRQGVAVYRRTASLMLYAAVSELYPEARVVIGQSLANGYYFDVSGVTIDEDFLADVETKMREYADQHIPIHKDVIPVEEARESFSKLRQFDTVGLLRARWDSHVKIIRLSDFCDLQHGPVAQSCGPIKHFRLVSYPPGIVLRFDARDESGRMSEIIPNQTKLFQTYRETRAWNEILGAPNVGRLNKTIIHEEVQELIRVAEGFHEKKIAAIADAVVSRTPDVRLVLISGPSSSGKTTFSKRLSLQLRVAGIRPVTVSLDDWYVNRVETPRDPKTGDYDFECLEALDLELFNENLKGLLQGQEVATPIYDFKLGVRVPQSEWHRMKLDDDQVLIVEGIHGLNDRLTAAIDSKHKFKIYVSALTQLCLDDHNRIFTSDTRLLRRIVRDARYRGYDAATTLLRWPSVRDGERKYIFPFQEFADVMFNSALVYEVSVLKVFAEHFLLAVPPSSQAYPEAYRMLKFLEHFVPAFRDDVPQISILREFIGGSAFVY